MSSVRSEIALRRRPFSVSKSFSRFTWSDFRPPYSLRQRYYVTSVTPIERIASGTLWPCDVKTSTWRSFATISSGLCLFLDIAVLLGKKPYFESDHFSGGGSRCLRRNRHAALGTQPSGPNPQLTLPL